MYQWYQTGHAITAQRNRAVVVVVIAEMGLGWLSVWAGWLFLLRILRSHKLFWVSLSLFSYPPSL